MIEVPETYPMPPHGWTCFFCGETFTTVGAARDHFGADQLADAACRIKVGEERGLVMALRRAEVELACYCDEDSDKDRELHAMDARHRQELIDAEQRGYDRGVADLHSENAQLRTQVESAVRLLSGGCPEHGSLSYAEFQAAGGHGCPICASKRAETAEAEASRLVALLNTPEVLDFIKGVQLEAAHQRERWGADHDANKTPEDWLWVVAYLTTKAAQAARYGDRKKYLHHIVTVAGACANWHRNALGEAHHG